MLESKEMREIKPRRGTYLSLVLLCCYRLGENVHRSPASRRRNVKHRNRAAHNKQSQKWRQQPFTSEWGSLCTAASPLGWWLPQTWESLCCWCRRSSHHASSWLAAAGGHKSTSTTFFNEGNNVESDINDVYCKNFYNCCGTLLQCKKKTWEKCIKMHCVLRLN